MPLIGPEPDDERSTATEQKFDWDGGTEFACGPRSGRRLRAVLGM